MSPAIVVTAYKLKVLPTNPLGHIPRCPILSSLSVTVYAEAAFQALHVCGTMEFLAWYVCEEEEFQASVYDAVELQASYVYGEVEFQASCACDEVDFQASIFLW